MSRTKTILIVEEKIGNVTPALTKTILIVEERIVERHTCFVIFTSFSFSLVTQSFSS
jgi:hypothetical protein